jgi:hypothetical protein
MWKLYPEAMHTYMDDHLLTLLTQDDTGLTPGEIIHPPKRVEGEEKRKGRDCNDIEDHPTNHIPLTTHDEDQCLETIDSRDHDEGQRWNGLVLSRYQIDQVDDL